MNKCFIPEKYLPGTVAIVTGGFSGIGLTLATEAIGDGIGITKPATIQTNTDNNKNEKHSKLQINLWKNIRNINVVTHNLGGITFMCQQFPSFVFDCYH